MLTFSTACSLSSQCTRTLITVWDSVVTSGCANCTGVFMSWWWAPERVRSVNVLCHLWVLSPECVYTVLCSRQSVKCINDDADGVLPGKASCIRKYLIHKDVITRCLTKTWRIFICLLFLTTRIMCSFPVICLLRSNVFLGSQRQVDTFSHFFHCCHGFQRAASHLQPRWTYFPLIKSVILRNNAIE